MIGQKLSLMQSKNIYTSQGKRERHRTLKIFLAQNCSLIHDQSIKNRDEIRNCFCYLQHVAQQVNQKYQKCHRPKNSDGMTKICMRKKTQVTNTLHHEQHALHPPKFCICFYCIKTKSIHVTHSLGNNTDTT